LEARKRRSCKGVKGKGVLGGRGFRGKAYPPRSPDLNYDRTLGRDPGVEIIFKIGDIRKIL